MSILTGFSRMASRMASRRAPCIVQLQITRGESGIPQTATPGIGIDPSTEERREWIKLIKWSNELRDNMLKPKATEEPKTIKVDRINKIAGFLFNNAD
jgi:hypothetical protein